MRAIETEAVRINGWANAINLTAQIPRERLMKRIMLAGIVITLTALFSSRTAPAEKTTAPTAPAITAATETAADAEREIRRLNLEYDNAILHRDAATLVRLIAEDFVVTKMGGKISTKAQEIAAAKAGETKFEMGRSEDVKVRLYGDTAIVNGRWIEKSNAGGKPFDGSHMYTTVYRRSNGGWQIVSDQVTPVTT
jgi:ketosteroid isomerase-like protein